MTRMTCSNEAAGRILIRGLNSRGWGCTSIRGLCIPCAATVIDDVVKIKGEHSVVRGLSLVTSPHSLPTRFIVDTLMRAAIGCSVVAMD